MKERTLGEERCEEIGRYIVETGATVRQAARRFGVSKSTVHTAVTVGNGSCGGSHEPFLCPGRTRRLVSGSDLIAALQAETAGGHEPAGASRSAPCVNLLSVYRIVM